MAWFWLRGVFAVCFGLMLIYDIYKISKGERDRTEIKKKSPRYRPYLSSYILPLYVLLVMGLMMLQKRTYIVQDTVFCLFGVFLHISVYYGVLMLTLPYLRKHFSSRVCAILWIIPNYLYIFVSLPLGIPKPLLVVPLLAVSSRILIGIWLVGFMSVLGWKIITHLRFRKKILGSAEQVTDVTMLRLWGDAQVSSGIVRVGDPSMRYIPLVQSDQVSTPVAVGLMRGSIHMVMPKRTYSAEELAMIFEHEVIHIGREDSWTKFFLVFCTAMCWFNPLMWIAMRRCAEDVELSCDETVLLGAEDGKKKQYAQLLLKTAGDDRGFTTCLSATGQAMRYRLSQVMEAPKRQLGLILAAGVSIVLLMSYGVVTLSYDFRTGTEVIFQDGETQHIMSVRTDQSPEVVVTSQEPVVSQRVETAIHEYLSQLQLYRLTGDYGVEDSGHRLYLNYGLSKLRVSLSDQKMEIYRGGTGFETYYLTEPVDWEEVYALLTP